MWFIVIVQIIACIPLPDKWNVIVDEMGARVEDYEWFISMYLILTACFFIISIATNNVIAKILFWMSWGKVVDQFYNPYGLHLLEIIWDVVAITWTLYTTRKWRINRKL